MVTLSGAWKATYFSAFLPPTNSGILRFVPVTTASEVGAPFTVHNVQDLLGSPIVSGTYGGGSVSVPTSGVTPPVPIGGSPVAPIHTGPDFDAFLVTGTSP